MRGSLTPLVTPFSNGQIDRDAFAGLVERQLESGSRGIVVGGTTREPGTLTLEEREALLEQALEVAGSRAPVIAGTGTNELEGTLRLTSHASAAGAAAVLVVTPYYLKPSQHGLVDWFTRVAGTVELPLILYDIPGRSGVALAVETIATLAQLPNIVGVKEARADLDHITTRCVMSWQGASVAGPRMI